MIDTNMISRDCTAFATTEIKTISFIEYQKATITKILFKLKDNLLADREAQQLQQH